MELRNHVLTKFHKEPGKLIIESIQDAEPFIEHNKQMASQLNKKEEWWYIGSIPNIIMVKWARESNTKLYTKEWSDYAFKQLNKPEYRAFNVNRIRV